ncbi:EKC/KEOPS complex subunit BUD32 [Escovopsis weberi]|uniref:EKC/KEOPS complex subunit BUD32 n=1 Tax=Escovopsis weberi TaxID=150374 RepID=A0A0M8N7M5_ESCWE|nr:EKC/KEOPS complex subunit BUD32 [Escovopsis weberi]
MASTAPAPADPSQQHEFPLPPILQLPSSAPPTLIIQGAEGRLYKSTYLLPSLPCALKYRPPKPWRHPALDQRLTRHRILSEARILAKCRRDGLRVPAVYALDEAAGWLMLEWIPGTPVRVNINRRLGDPKHRDPNADPNSCDYTYDARDDAPLRDLMRRIGAAVGKMHDIGIIHGDLTTSNMMLAPPPDHNSNNNDDDESNTSGSGLDGEIVIIDLGLASGGVQEEDRAVDLYVLERAFGSTHPRAECLFGELLDAYRKNLRGAGVVLKKLEEVRMRGRKRSMLG